MNLIARYGCILLAVIMGVVRPLGAADSAPTSNPISSGPHYGAARLIGRIESAGLVECSGMDVSMAAEDLLWAINDGGNGPFVYALGGDGRDRGRIRVAGVDNRDWEGLDTFVWQGRAMILIADFGDNFRRRATYSIFIVEEPRLEGDRLMQPTVVQLAWRIDFSYPDGPHDAEGVAVDGTAEEVLVLTKRDHPPLLFALPLRPPPAGRRVTARRVAKLDRIPPPTREDRRHPHGDVRSQPTALDLSGDSRSMVVLTYKHAYLFSRAPGQTWAATVGERPALIRLPLPQNIQGLRQREAICFSPDNTSLLVTSEGRGAGIFLLKAR